MVLSHLPGATVRRPPFIPSIHSSHPSAAYMCRWTGSSLVHAMACRLFGAKPLPEPMLTYCQLDPSMKFESKYKIFHSWKFIWKCCLPNWPPFCPGGDELRSDLGIDPLIQWSLVLSLKTFEDRTFRMINWVCTRNFKSGVLGPNSFWRMESYLGNWTPETRLNKFQY